MIVNNELVRIKKVYRELLLQELTWRSRKKGKGILTRVYLVLPC